MPIYDAPLRKQEDRAMKCVFGCPDAVAIYILTEGCMCCEQIVQPLCKQHEYDCTPVDDMILVVRLDEASPQYSSASMSVRTRDAAIFPAHVAK
jgi:hypothetical protein